MKKVSLFFVIALLMFSCGGNNNETKDTSKEAESQQQVLTPEEKAFNSLEKDGIIIPEVLKNIKMTRSGGEIEFKSDNLDSAVVVEIEGWLRKQVKEMQDKGWEQWKPYTYNLYDDNKDDDGFYFETNDEFKFIDKSIALKIKPKNITKAVMFYLNYSYPIKKEKNNFTFSIKREESDL